MIFSFLCRTTGNYKKSNDFGVKKIHHAVRIPYGVGSVGADFI